MTKLGKKLVAALGQAIDASDNYRVLVCGGRNYNDYATVYRELDLLQHEHGPLTIIQGGAPGADELARRWAYRVSPAQSVTLITCPADWEAHGKAAGPIRNGEMLKEKPHQVLAFPGGKGTNDMVKKAQAANVEVRKVGW